jgi:hypothetical protein
MVDLDGWMFVKGWLCLCLLSQKVEVFSTATPRRSSIEESSYMVSVP